MADFERTDFIQVWSRDPNSALAMFGLKPQEHDVIVLKDAPSSKRERDKYDPRAKLYGICEKRPADHYTLRLCDGEYVRGPIQGCGGTIPAGQHDRVQIEIDRANARTPLSIYEPVVGCCSMHKYDPEQKLDLEDRRRIVNLRGATLLDKDRS